MDGTTATVHDKAGDDARDVMKTYESSEDASLGVFENTEIEGTWKLSVIDDVPRDVGRLAYWSLDIEYKSGATAFGRAQPDALVPDSSPTGVQSTIPLNQTGTVKGILVSVKIEHTYIGDLAVDLVTPSGASARPAEWHVSSGRLQARWSGPGGRASSPRHAESQRGRRGRVGDA